MALFGNSKKKHRAKEAKSSNTTSQRHPQPPPQQNGFYQQGNNTKSRLNNSQYAQYPPPTQLYQHSNHTRTQSTPYYDAPPPIYYSPPRPHTSHGYQQPYYAPPPPIQPPRIASPSHFLLPQPHPQQYVPSPPQPLRPQKSGLGKFGASMNSLLLTEPIPNCVPGAKIINDGLSPYQRHGTQYLNQGAALCDQIASKFNEVMTSIDCENFNGNESGLLIHDDQERWERQQGAAETSRGLGRRKEKGQPKGILKPPSSSVNYFSKVNLYANSRLPANLPPLKLYMPTYPLLCLAAQYSERVYTRPEGKERDTHVDADWKNGTKAMVLKSVPMDDMSTIVFAIRGSQTFMDWAVNLNSAPASAEGFLDDPGNFCHSGFLSVARRMIRPVAARLRALIEEDPNRSRYSLLITGHSAGGAVASLLYSHMLCTSLSAASELNTLTSYFKRVHCVTFGAPPVSLLPLKKPDREELRKSLFLSFVNEGDPVPRADVAYVRSLLDLYSSPAPALVPRMSPGSSHSLVPHKTSQKLRNTTSTLTLRKHRPPAPQSSNLPTTYTQPLWPVPDAALSNAGRVVLLRSAGEHGAAKRRIADLMNDGVVAQVIDDELLRGVIWGDPVCHMMKLYARRIEVLATNAVLGRS